MKRPMPNDLVMGAQILSSLLKGIQKYLSGLDVSREDINVTFKLLNEDPIRILGHQRSGNATIC